jgi:hypothetical protein
MSRANHGRLVSMFAPWCPTCRSRMLLGPRRVVAIEPGPAGPRAVLRCHCGTLVVWSTGDPDGPEGHAPMASTRSVPSEDTTVMAGAVKLDT